MATMTAANVPTSTLWRPARFGWEPVAHGPAAALEQIAHPGDQVLICGRLPKGLPLSDDDGDDEGHPEPVEAEIATEATPGAKETACGLSSVDESAAGRLQK